MSLALRVIPTLLHRGYNLIKGKQFVSTRGVGSLQQAFKIHQTRKVDETIVIDLAASDGFERDWGIIHKLSNDNFSPLTVGGGIRSITDCTKLLAMGADKVCIGRAILTEPALLAQIADRFGSQAVVAAIDTNYGKVWCHGQEVDVMTPAELARNFQHYGAGEILLTGVEREGMMQGYDLATIEAVSNAVTIPVIAHGGCSCPDDALDAVKAGASAVAIGALFQFEDVTPLDVSRYLTLHGIEARIG